MRGAGPATHGEAPPRPPPAPRACTPPHARARPATVPRVARTETGAATPLSDLGLACQGPPARSLSLSRSGNSAQAGGTERDRRQVAPMPMGWLAVMAQFPPPEPHPKRACHARNDPRRHRTASALHRTGHTCYTGCSTKRLSSACGSLWFLVGWGWVGSSRQMPDVSRARRGVQARAFPGAAARPPPEPPHGAQTGQRTGRRGQRAGRAVSMGETRRAEAVGRALR